MIQLDLLSVISLRSPFAIHSAISPSRDAILFVLRAVVSRVSCRQSIMSDDQILIRSLLTSRVSSIVNLFVPVFDHLQFAHLPTLYPFDSANSHQISTGSYRVTFSSRRPLLTDSQPLSNLFLALFPAVFPFTKLNLNLTSAYRSRTLLYTSFRLKKFLLKTFSKTFSKKFSSPSEKESETAENEEFKRQKVI